jgi:hypothetical protein
MSEIFISSELTNCGETASVFPYLQAILSIVFYKPVEGNLQDNNI